ncbi:hypothetical protein B0T24DRAFT_725142 [Lasiosphaeria ovina]|uniref:YCII-related domain-containing protein n=1 Tax=Lasiosphaeria ovina TaxID=92902 RepID=A0AAE0MYG7_9PEZI|nr:hypothetical protein B0T24DRAFT_725142 [Lasiosphaeria ovina]
MPDWLVQISDHRDATGEVSEAVLQARRDNFTVHAAHNKRHVEAGHVVVSGPLLASHDDEPRRPVGSVMVWSARSEAEVRAWLREDPYAQAGIWDLARATVTPYFCAVRAPL